MGDVDLVVQVEAPPSTASGLQRVGRAGHNVGDASRGVIIPKHRADLLHATVVADRMARGELEPIRMPRHPLDVLAQQTVAAAAMDELRRRRVVPDRAAGGSLRAALARRRSTRTLDLVAGVYPSDEFAELRPRVVWDREAGTIVGRPSAQRIAVSSGGTIPDRGLFGVFLAGQEGKPGARVGELDEEMVYETRTGDVFALGATSWRVVDITHDRVLVVPAFGEVGQAAVLARRQRGPAGRPGRFDRAGDRGARRRHRLRAARTPTSARAATSRPTCATSSPRPARCRPIAQLVVERSRDELGDWRLIVHSPYGRRVHAPWALAIDRRLREDRDMGAAAMASDDGIVIRIPDSDAEPPGADLIRFEPDELERIVETEAGGTALFASRFRECAARALLLPKRDPARRAPLWQQRQRAAQLLDVAKRYPDFPIVLEALREVLQDAYDLPALRRSPSGCSTATSASSRSRRRARRRSRTTCCSATSAPSSTRATRRSPSGGPRRSRSTRRCSPRCSARPRCASCSTRAVVERIELELQRLAPDRRARGVEGAADLLRLLGPLRVDELAERLRPEGRRADAPLDAAARRRDRRRARRRAPRRARADRRRGADRGDRGRRPAARRARGAAAAPACRRRCSRRSPTRSATSSRRHARTHGPFTVDDVGARLALAPPSCARRCGRSRRRAACCSGAYRPGGSARSGSTRRCCRRLKRRSLQALRSDVEPVDHAVFADHLLAHQRVARPLTGTDGRARGDRRPRRRAAAAQRARDAHPALARERLPAVDARRADRARARELGRRGRAHRQRRPHRAARRPTDRRQRRDAAARRSGGGGDARRARRAAARCSRSS